MQLRVQLLMILFCGIALGQSVPKVNSNYDYWNSSKRMARDLSPHEDEGYVITPQRLKEIRSQFLYWFFDLNSRYGDHEYAMGVTLHRDLKFQLPFLGFRFNYIMVSINGYLEFPEPFVLGQPRLPPWTNSLDPPIIAPFYSICLIGRIYRTDIDLRPPGFYFRIESDLMTRTDRFGVEVRERVMWDIREGVFGAETFIPKHAIIVTWKNMSFAGSGTSSLLITNTFQMVLATDEVSTYAIFNYAAINWIDGERRLPAFVGFKSFNETYAYKPYSQSSVIRNLTSHGYGNGFPGRHLFRVDNQIITGSCDSTAGQGYVITAQRLKEIRSQFLYWFFDKDSNCGRSDYQSDIHASVTQLHKNLTFQLPFFGFRFNYIRVSMNGYLEFSYPPDYSQYPLIFPVKDWPKRNDPSFIGPWYSKCRIGHIYKNDIDRRTPGVYFRIESDLMTRTDRFGVEVRERVMWDIREGVVGAETFIPKHAVIVTWKNMSFAGSRTGSLFRTNTFQTVLATDEVSTYAIFNYATINWTSHVEAGGNSEGDRGIPAFVGFNAGNGTQSYAYQPYSQSNVIRNLTSHGCGNGFPGRHLFRIDHQILTGSCEIP